MNINQILTEIEKFDPEVSDRLDSRRETIRNYTKSAGRLALAAIPLALGGMFSKAYAGTNSVSSIVDVLNFALTLEYLEADYYIKGVGTTGLIPGDKAIKAFKIIRDHEKAHVKFLQTTIQSLGGTPVTKPKFDFTAGGTYADVFSNYDTFLAVSQTFEDTGVRAYKGQAGNLISDNTVLQAALQIHSVEARHAAHVRYKRYLRTGDESIRQWITNASSGGIGASVRASYDGEDNTNQLGVAIIGINGFDINMQDATEAFDEPLTMDQVLAIVDPFIV